MSEVKTLLVVEDERVVALDIQRSLTELGYRVPATAASAEQAIELADQYRPDLVLMDIRIKGQRDGIETAAILRERFKVPVIYLTAYADATTVERAKQTEPYGYLLKPVKSSELRTTVEVALYKLQTDVHMRTLNEALERSNIELQRFAYVVAHDLQSPMRSIAGFVELLHTTYGEKLDAQANDWMRRTVASVKQLQSLIRDLLEYSRVDSQALPFERVQLRDSFDQAVALLDASIRESNASVTCGDLPVVMGDRSQLVQLMLNLIGNGIKFRGAEAPRIHVSAERGAAEWTISVRDNGIGIAERHQEQIFELFRRLHDQKQYPGTGIGLAVCRRMMQRHGGRIWVESEVGKGSSFRFTFPVIPSSVA